MSMREPNQNVRQTAAGPPTGPSLGQQAGDKVAGAVDRVQDAMGQVADTVAPMVDQAQEKAGQVSEQARSQLTSRLDGQKDRLVSGLGMVALAVRQTGQQMREQDQETVAQYAETAAERVEKVSQYLRRTDSTELIGEVEAYARRQPTLFLGGGLALGLLLSRFFKSSGQRAAEAAARPSVGMGNGITGRPTAPYSASNVLQPPYGSSTAPPRPTPGTTGMPAAPMTPGAPTRPGSAGAPTSSGTPSTPDRPTPPNAPSTPSRPTPPNAPSTGVTPRPGDLGRPPATDPKAR